MSEEIVQNLYPCILEMLVVFKLVIFNWEILDRTYIMYDNILLMCTVILSPWWSTIVIRNIPN